MKTRLLLATAMISGLIAGVPATASADIPSCVNDYFWAGNVLESYECATEEFPQCVNDYFWAGQVLQSYKCAKDPGPR